MSAVHRADICLSFYPCGLCWSLVQEADWFFLLVSCRPGKTLREISSRRHSFRVYVGYQLRKDILWMLAERGRPTVHCAGTFCSSSTNLEPCFGKNGSALRATYRCPALIAPSAWASWLRHVDELFSVVECASDRFCVLT